MIEKLELKSCHEVIDTVDVANIESIFYGGKPTDPDILTVVMKGGKRLYCDEVCPIDSLKEENPFDSHIQEGDKITINEDGGMFNRSQLEAYKKGFLEGWNSCFKMYGSGETIKEDELSKYKTITELLSKCADMCKKEGGAKHDLKRKK